MMVFTTAPPTWAPLLYHGRPARCFPRLRLWCPCRHKALDVLIDALVAAPVILVETDDMKSRIGLTADLIFEGVPEAERLPRIILLSFLGGEAGSIGVGHRVS